jgi:hypothetical protein
METIERKAPREVRVLVDVGRPQGLVPEPEGDDRDVDLALGPVNSAVLPCRGGSVRCSDGEATPGASSRITEVDNPQGRATVS